MDFALVHSIFRPAGPGPYSISTRRRRSRSCKLYCCKTLKFPIPTLLNSKLSRFNTPALSFLSLTPRHTPLVISTSRPARALTNLHPSLVEPRPVIVLISISARRTRAIRVGVLVPREDVRAGVPGGANRYSTEVIQMI
jgi:hypothetical protein